MPLPVRRRDENNQRVKSNKKSLPSNSKNAKNKYHENGTRTSEELKHDYRIKKCSSKASNSGRRFESSTRTNSRRMILQDNAATDNAVLRNNHEPSMANLSNQSLIFESGTSMHYEPSAFNPSNRNLNFNNNSNKHIELRFNPSNRNLRLSSNNSSDRELPKVLRSNSGLSLNSCSSTNRNSSLSQSHRSRVSSNRSFTDSCDSFNSSIYSNISYEWKQKRYNYDDFISDIEDDDDDEDDDYGIVFSLRTNDREQNFQASTGSTKSNRSQRARSRERYQHDHNNNYRNSIPRENRNRRASRILESKRGRSSHDTLEGVYSNHRSGFKIEKSENIGSREEEPTKLTKKPKEKGTTNSISIKDHRRSRRQRRSKDLDLVRIEQRRMKVSRSKTDRNSLRQSNTDDYASSRRLLRGKADGAKNHRETRDPPRSVTNEKNDASFSNKESLVQEFVSSSENNIDEMPIIVCFADDKATNIISLYDLLSNSGHCAKIDMIPLHKNGHSLPSPSFASDSGTEESTKKKKGDGMLKKMRMGLTASRRTTTKKVASNYNLFGQSTFKAFTGRTEEFS